MNLKNKELKKIHSALISLGNHQEDISNRWEIVKMAKKLENPTELYDREIQVLVAKQENKKLYIDNPDYIKLSNIQIDIDINYITLEDIKQYSPTVQELALLYPIIKEE